MCQEVGHPRLVWLLALGLAPGRPLCRHSVVLSLVRDPSSCPLFLGGAWGKDGVEGIWRLEFLRAGRSVETESDPPAVGLPPSTFILGLGSLYVSACFKAASHIRMWLDFTNLTGCSLIIKSRQ